MTANLQVTDETLKLLNQVKKEIKAANYDQVIKYLINEKKKVPRSPFVSSNKFSALSQEEDKSDYMF
jgi:hypothetical protein